MSRKRKRKSTKPREENYENDSAVKSIEAQRNSNRNRLSSVTSSIRARAEQARTAQGDVNVRTLAGTQVMGLRSGRERYAAEVQGGIMAAQESAGLERLRSIDNDEISLISDAEAAEAQNDFQLLNQKITLIETKREEKRKLAQDQLKLQQEQDIKVKEAEQKQSRQGAIIGLMKQGVNDPLDIFDYVNYDDKGELIGDISLDEVIGVIENIQKTDKSVGDLRQFLDSKRQGAIPQDMQFFDFKQEFAKAGTYESPLDTELKKLNLSKGYKELSENNSNTLKEALSLQREFGADYAKRPEVQRLSVSQDAFSTAKSIIGDRDIKVLTVAQVTALDLQESDAETIAKQLARIQNPDTARAADNGDILAADSINQKQSQFYNKLIAGNKVLPDKVLSTLQTIDKIYKSRVKAVEPVNTEFKALSSTFGVNVNLQGALNTGTVMVGGKPVAVGSTITTKNGKRGRVNADGTITKI